MKEADGMATPWRPCAEIEAELNARIQDDMQKWLSAFGRPMPFAIEELLRRGHERELHGQPLQGQSK